MEIKVNGESRSVAEGETIRTLLTALRLDPARVAVELDREIVKPPVWGETALRPGAELEIVQFVGGG